MPLKLVTGPANSGKAGELLGAVRARLDDDPVLVVPRHEDVEHAGRELARDGAVLGVRVVRFAGLMELVASRADPQLANATRASALARELLVAEAVRGTRLRAIAESARQPGFVRAASRFVAELGGAMVDPARLTRALDAWAGGGPRQAYAGDLAALYAAYSETLDRAGLVDDQGFARRALDALRRRPHTFGRSPVLVYGFDDFTPLELDAIETLARPVGVEVTVSLPFERARLALRAGASTFSLLSELADEHLELPASAEHYAPAARPALSHLERRLFEDGDAPASGTESVVAASRPPVWPGEAVTLHVAGGERAEVELSGAEVLRALDAGVPAGEVAVVVRDPAGYGTLIEEVYGAYGIPFSLERTMTFGHTALGRGLLALLRCASGAGSAADLVAYLRTPGLLRSPHLADDLEAEVRRSGAESVATARDVWESRRWPLTEIDRLPAAAGGPRLLDELDDRLERLLAGSQAREAHLLSGGERQDAAALRAARAALADVAALTATGCGPPLELSSLERLLGGLTVRIGDPPSPDRVRVAAPEAVRARRFAVVIVLGLQEGEFPRRAAPEPFLSDDARREISADAGLELPVREDELDRERLLFYACVSRARERLVLSTRSSDEEGAPQSPSSFVADVRTLFAEGALEETAVRRTLAEPTWTAERAPTEREHARALAAAGPRGPADSPSRLRHEGLLADLAGRRDFSAGELEAFAACPVGWLVERSIRPRSFEPDPEPLVRGRYAHDVLRLALELLRERTGSARVTPENLAEAETALSQALDELGERHPISPRPSRRTAARHRLERDLLRHLRREAAAGSRFEPEHLELSFGMGPTTDGGSAEADPEGLPALELEPEGLRVRGRIDRVDRLGERALVRDYKGGTRVAGASGWEAADELQVALYMLAVRDLLDLEPAGGLYVSLAGRGSSRGVVLEDAAEDVGATASRSDLRDARALDGVLAAARVRAGEIADRLRAGDVRPCPESCAPAGGCRYPSICREERP